MKLTLGFSPCPNDTFIFDAIVNSKIDTGGLEFEAVMEDVETLNEWAAAGRLDISKLSFPAFFRSRNSYILLSSGGALGKGVGPLLISRNKIQNKKTEDCSIAIPGINTTANFLLGFAFPSAVKKIPMIFSAIEEAVLNGQTELGVIIHENRFTYAEKGLQQVLDLGEYWEQKTNLPVPLGGIAIKKTVDRLISLKADQLIRKSIQYAFEKYPLLPDYVKQHAQSMSEDVMRKHISLYVNEYSSELGTIGKKAIEKLFEQYQLLHQKGPGVLSSSPLFLS